MILLVFASSLDKGTAVDGKCVFIRYVHQYGLP
jgi:hypothetical protein